MAVNLFHYLIQSRHNNRHNNLLFIVINFIHIFLILKEINFDYQLRRLKTWRRYDDILFVVVVLGGTDLLKRITELNQPDNQLDQHKVVPFNIYSSL